MSGAGQPVSVIGYRIDEDPFAVRYDGVAGMYLLRLRVAAVRQCRKVVRAVHRVDVGRDGERYDFAVRGVDGVPVIHLVILSARLVLHTLLQVRKLLLVVSALEFIRDVWSPFVLSLFAHLDDGAVVAAGIPQVRVRPACRARLVVDLHRVDGQLGQILVDALHEGSHRHERVWKPSLVVEGEGEHLALALVLVVGALLALRVAHRHLPCVTSVTLRLIAEKCRHGHLDHREVDRLVADLVGRVVDVRVGIAPLWDFG